VGDDLRDRREKASSLCLPCQRRLLFSAEERELSQRTSTTTPTPASLPAPPRECVLMAAALDFASARAAGRWEDAVALCHGDNSGWVCRASERVESWECGGPLVERRHFRAFPSSLKEYRALVTCLARLAGLLFCGAGLAIGVGEEGRIRARGAPTRASALPFTVSFR